VPKIYGKTRSSGYRRSLFAFQNKLSSWYFFGRSQWLENNNSRTGGAMNYKNPFDPTDTLSGAVFPTLARVDNLAAPKGRVRGPSRTLPLPEALLAVSAPARRLAGPESATAQRAFIRALGRRANPNRLGDGEVSPCRETGGVRLPGNLASHLVRRTSVPFISSLWLQGVRMSHLALSKDFSVTR